MRGASETFVATHRPPGHTFIDTRFVSVLFSLIDATSNDGVCARAGVENAETDINTEITEIAETTCFCFLCDLCDLCVECLLMFSICGRSRAHSSGPRSAVRRGASRSEEHTSELQSRFGISYAVF